MHANPASCRRHSAEFKAQVLATCGEPGASVAAIALAHGLNANLVRKWLAGRGLKRHGVAVPLTTPVDAPATAAVFAPNARFLPVAASDAPGTGPAAVGSVQGMAAT